MASHVGHLAPRGGRRRFGFSVAHHCGSGTVRLAHSAQPSSKDDPAEVSSSMSRFFSDPAYRAALLKAPRDPQGQIDWSLRPPIPPLRMQQDGRKWMEEIPPKPLPITGDTATATADQARRAEEIAVIAGRQADAMVAVIDGAYTSAVECAEFSDPGRPGNDRERALALGMQSEIAALFDWVAKAKGPYNVPRRMDLERQVVKVRLSERPRLSGHPAPMV